MSRRTGVGATTGRFIAPNVLFLNLVCLVGAVAIQPMYASVQYLLVVGAALVVANAAAVVGALRSWSPVRVALILAGFYATAGVPLAVPSAMTSPSRIAVGWLELIGSVVTGWKSILTLSLPLGSYRATLAPILLLFLLVPAVAVSLALRSRAGWAAAAAVVSVLPVFAVLFGSSASSGARVWGGIQVRSPRELAIGLASVGTLLVWFAWRGAYARRRAIRRIQVDSGVRLTARARAHTARRFAGAVAMVAAAIVGTHLVAPAIAAGQPREVLRTWIDPQVRLQRELSPLTTYRLFLDNSHYDSVLFSVDVGDTKVDRVRLATLSCYDGVVFRACAGAGVDAGGSFDRVPSTMSSGLKAPRRVEAKISIGTYSGIWLPTVGGIASIRFDGPNRQALSDDFFYQSTADTGVLLGSSGLQPGDEFVEDAYLGSDTATVASLSPVPGAVRHEGELVPESLRKWVANQRVPPNGAGLVTLVERLRARGYLTHAVTLPDSGEPPRWVADLADYRFEPGASGHSLDRIDRMFVALLAREDEVAGTNDADLVAAFGDDEQFAVAATMLARELGFPARVVLGARLVDTDPMGWSAPACTAGRCSGRNMSVWIEVQSADGRWVPLDVTPQRQNAPAPQVDLQRDPQNSSEVDPPHGQTVIPPSSQRGGDQGHQPDAGDRAAETNTWYAAMKVLGTVSSILLLVTGPFLLIVAAKGWRRRSRRRRGSATDRMASGWEEYVDAALDHGHAYPRNETRSELAAQYGTTAGPALAVHADRAVFGPVEANEQEAAQFWQLVDAQRAELARSSGRWARLRARLSTRSLRRVLSHDRAADASGNRLVSSSRIGRLRDRATAAPLLGGAGGRG